MLRFSLIFYHIFLIHITKYAYHQLADIFTKSLRGPRIKYICDKLGAFDLYVPA